MDLRFRLPPYRPEETASDSVACHQYWESIMLLRFIPHRLDKSISLGVVLRRTSHSRMHAHRVPAKPLGAPCADPTLKPHTTTSTSSNTPRPPLACSSPISHTLLLLTTKPSKICPLTPLRRQANPSLMRKNTSTAPQHEPPSETRLAPEMDHGF